MKVLLFTHISDIDGLNNVILAKEAFDRVDYVLCEASEIDEKIECYKQSFDKYDFIYVTDLCPTRSILDFINNSEYKVKFKVFDHHKNALDENIYDFVTLKNEDIKGMCSGTSLFYQYLVKNKYLNSNVTLDKFVELTRRYDTWEWKKYNDMEACNLMYLFNAVGIDKYLKTISKRIKESKFELNKKDITIINNWKKDFDKKITEAVNNIIYLNILGYKAGIVTVDHEYRNDIVEYVRNNNYDIDFLVIILNDRDAISYRNVKDIDVGKIAKHYGGNGHKAAAGSPITEEEKKDIIKYFDK